MVTRDDTGRQEVHYVRPCKKHGDVHTWMQIGEIYHCLLCMSALFEKHLGQVGVAEICPDSLPKK